MPRGALRTAVLLLLAVGIAGAGRAQGAYLLRYEPGSRAAAVLDSLGFRQNTLDGDRQLKEVPPAGTRRPSGQTSPATAASSAEAQRQANRLTSDFVPFENLSADEGLVAVRRGVPASFWTNIPGVIAVGEGSAVFPKGGLPNDPTFPEQWNLRRIEAAGAWNYSTGGFTPGGRQIVIGVIEANGFDLNHPELVNQYYRNPGEVPGNGIDDDRNGYIDDVTGVNFINGQTAFRPDFHGVQVCGVLAAESDNGQQSTGLNWAAKLLPFHVDSVYKWALALDYLTTLRRRYNETDGAEGAYVVVANCSLGNRANCNNAFNIELNAAIDRAGQAGILVVGAVGNDTGDAERQSDIPASCNSDFLITVTAADRSDVILAGAGFSARQVDLSAPGAPFGGLNFSASSSNTFGQTSGATPQVAGVVALLYAAMCERTEDESLTAPAQVAARMKSTILESVDRIDAQSRMLSAGGRLNARRAVESMLRDESCDEGSFIVRFEEGTPPPARLLAATGAARLSDTLSAAWHIYRYREERPGSLTAGGLSMLPTVASAEAEVRLVTTGRNFGFGGDNGYLDEIAQPALASQVESGDNLPGSDGPFAAVFDIGFGESRTPVTGPRLNPRAPSIGLHGTASADITGTVAADPTQARVLKYAGYRRGDWIAAADDVAALRRAYDGGQASDGRRVVTLATGLDRVYRNSDAAGATAVTSFVLDELLTLGVIPVLPQGVYSDAPDELPILPRGTLLGSGLDGPDGVQRAPVLLAPSADLGFCLSEVPTQFDGYLAAAAQVAGGITLLSKLDCPGIAFASPRAEADNLIAALLGGAYETDAAVALDLGIAARLRTELCSGRELVGASLLSVFPNPIGAERRVRIIYAAQSEGSVTVYDMAGRRVAERSIARPTEGLGQLSLPLDLLPAGVYVLRLLSGGSVESTQIVVL